MGTRKYNGLLILNNIRKEITKDLEEILRGETQPVYPIRELFFKSFSSVIVHDDSTTLLSRCHRLDPKARLQILELIYQKLMSYDLNEREIDAVLSQYYINYYGTPSEITSDENLIGLSTIKRILIEKDSDYDVKMKKLSQVVYQETYGMTVIDEFIYMPPQNKTKIEEIACFGPDAFWIKVSAIDVKLDRIKIPARNLKPTVERLATCAEGFSLNAENNRISTDSLNKDRVSITCPDYSRYYEFNIRRHYPKAITTEERIKLGSTTRAFEKWLDDVMLGFPRIVLTGDQAVGKSTLLRSIVERYPSGTVLSTIESAYELELSKIPHLIVKQLKSLKISPEDAMEDSLRFGLHLMINGETRSGTEVSVSLQAGQRSSKGTITTTHAVDADALIRVWTQLLIRDKVFTSEASAKYNIAQATDIVIVPGVDNRGANATGLRYIDSVWEVPSYEPDKNEVFTTRLLFKARKGDFKLEQVGTLSPRTLEFLKGRNSGDSFDAAMHRLEELNYDREYN